LPIPVESVIIIAGAKEKRKKGARQENTPNPIVHSLAVRKSNNRRARIPEVRIQ
jgi:hypothetical protein